MTELQLGLAAIGVVAVLGIAAYNQWAIWRSRPLQTSVQPESEDQSHGGMAAISASAEHAFFEGDEHATHAAQRFGFLGPLDPLLDCMVTLLPEQPVTGEDIWATLPRSRRIGNKAFAVEGYNTSAHVWEVPKHGQLYRSLQVGIQLTNRSGALTEIEFSEFIAKVQIIADRLHAQHDDLPDMREEVLRARELDQFVAKHDIQMVFKVKAKRVAWSVGYIMQQAETLGFVPGAIPGRLVLPAQDAHGMPILALKFETRAALDEDPNRNALFEFDLLFQVPQVPRSEQAYARLRSIAESLALTVEGRLTDERGLAVTSEIWDTVGEQLDVLYQALDERDLAAGSAQSRRLFA